MSTFKEYLSENISSFEIGSVYRLEIAGEYGDSEYFLPESVQKNGRYKGKTIYAYLGKSGRTLYKKAINKSVEAYGKWELVSPREVPKEVKSKFNL